MVISLCIIIVLTCILSLIFLFVEHIAQPDVFADYGDAIVWAYTRYMEGGDGVFEGGPVTVVGKVIASLLGMIAHILHEQLASNETLRKEDIQELSSQGFGYPFEA